MDKSTSAKGAIDLNASKIASNALNMDMMELRRVLLANFYLKTIAFTLVDIRPPRSRF